MADLPPGSNRSALSTPPTLPPRNASPGTSPPLVRPRSSSSASGSPYAAASSFASGVRHHIQNAIGNGRFSKLDWGPLSFVKTHCRRALTPNLRGIAILPMERPILQAHGVRELTIQQYLVWRRSWLVLVLPVAALSFFIQLPQLFTTDYSVFNAMGATLLVVVTLLPLLGHPAAAVWALFRWDRHRQSRRVLVGGWVVSFLLPFLVALIPMHHFVTLPAGQPEATAQQLTYYYGLVGGMMWLLLLLPAILAMIPGILRACIRIKSLLPESIVPGWFLVLTAPAFSLILLLAFILVNQVAGNLLLVIGVLLLMGAPAVYVMRTPLLVRPLASADDRRQIEFLQILYIGIALLGLFFLLIYVFTLDVMGRPLVGEVVGSTGAYVGTGQMIWEIIKFLVNYLAKSLFMTAVAVDVFMLVNLSVWRQMKTFAKTADAESYDRLMEEFSTVAEGVTRRESQTNVER